MNNVLRKLARGLIVACAIAVPLACDRVATTGQSVNDPRIKPLPTIKMGIAGKEFNIEIADDEAERQTGLMYRTSMPADHGMIFVFDAPVDDPFWMKNTNIPLDIAYVDSDGVVKTVAQMYPHDLTGVASSAPYQYAIELNQGTAAKIGLKAGDRIAIPKLPK